MACDQSSFDRGQDLPFPHGKISQGQLTNSRPHQPQRRMADRSRHAANLSILSFHKFQNDPAVRDILAKAYRRITWRNLRLWIRQSRMTWQSPSPLNDQPRFQLLQTFGSRDSLHLHPVFSFVSVSGFQKPCVPFGLIAEQQQAFRIRVQPTNRIHVLWKAEFRQWTIPRTIGRELRQHTVWFVKSNQHQGCDAAQVFAIGDQLNPR